jgi:O-methyltransferase
MTKSPDFDIAYRQYVDLLIRCLANTIYKDPPVATWGDREFDREKRATGRDWPSRAHTMVGTARLRNLADLVRRALDERIPGDFIETGVWRGGACILVRGLLAAYGDPSRRVFVADSFAGLPPPNRDLYPYDNGMMLHLCPELAVSSDQVRSNFDAYGLLDERVIFIEGLFKDTLPALRNERFAVLRLDGDMYESTMDSLKNLYDAVSIGGFIIIDDYGAIEARRRAVHDFRDRRGITEAIVEIDWTGVWQGACLAPKNCSDRTPL